MATETPKSSPSDEKVLELSNSIAALSVEIETLKKAGNSKDDISALKTELTALKAELKAYQTRTIISPSESHGGGHTYGFWTFDE